MIDLGKHGRRLSYARIGFSKLSRRVRPASIDGFPHLPEVKNHESTNVPLNFIPGYSLSYSRKHFSFFKL